MADINLSYEDLTAAAARLRAGTEETESCLTGVTAMIDHLITAGYITDSSSTRFTAAYSEVNEARARLIEGLETMTRYLEATIQSYQEVAQGLAGDGLS